MANEKEFDTIGKIQTTGFIIGALGIIGFMGLIWLMIYGNLDGNLGFVQVSTPFANETVTLTSLGVTPSTAQGRVNGVLTNVFITNATGGENITVANYSVSGVIISAVLTPFNDTDVNVSAVVTYDSQGKIQSDGVINNVSGGFGTFFGFSNTFFTIAAIILLIFMLLGLLSMVMLIMNMQNKKRDSNQFAHA